MTDIPNISTARAVNNELSTLALGGIDRERKMSEAFYDFAANVMNHATKKMDGELMALVERAHEAFKGAAK